MARQHRLIAAHAQVGNKLIAAHALGEAALDVDAARHLASQLQFLANNKLIAADADVAFAGASAEAIAALGAEAMDVGAAAKLLAQLDVAAIAADKLHKLLGANADNGRYAINVGKPEKEAGRGASGKFRGNPIDSGIEPALAGFAAPNADGEGPLKRNAERNKRILERDAGGNN